MKKLITLSITALSINLVHAQTTLDANNTPHSPQHSSIRNVLSQADMSVAPQHGTGITYDYSGALSSSVDTIPYLPATRTGFENNTRFSYTVQNLASLPLVSEFYTHKTNVGIYRAGGYKLPQKFGIGAITGTGTDTLAFPGNPGVFQEEDYILKFPAAVGENWQASFTFSVLFNLTVTNFGLNNVPGEMRQFVVKRDSVVGSGNLIVPTANGASIPYPVILVKSQMDLIDSVFLGGAPAPAALLSAFGLSQGNAFTTQVYSFYSPNFERPLMELQMASNWTTIQKGTNTTHYISEGVQTINTIEYAATETKVYPNPVKAGQQLFISLKSNPNITSFRLVGIDGRVYVNEILANNQDKLAVQLPSNMAQGMYLIQTMNTSGAVVSTSKIMITQ